MHGTCVRRWQDDHDHAFGQESVRPGERRTRIVIALTAAMMAVEIVAGLAFGSMALLADGLHMASHTAALGLAALAYAYARRHARDARYSFGTGKVNALAGFAGAVLLGVFAGLMALESAQRLWRPVTIDFDDALLVAVAGLLVNAVCAVILGGHVLGEPRDADPHRHDHNLRSAYLHVIADALTSVLAILALAGGKYLGSVWLDPAIGLFGGLLVARWSWSLVRQAGAVLLDRQAPDSVREAIRTAIESGSDDRLVDLHVWCVAPGHYAAILVLVTADPQPPDHYRELLPHDLDLTHVNVEVHPCVHEDVALSAGSRAR